jgi:hypothetical protein
MSTSIDVGRVTELHEHAERWALTAIRAGLTPSYAWPKALSSVRMCIRRGASRLVIPSKLVGVKPHQHTIRAPPPIVLRAA